MTERNLDNRNFSFSRRNPFQADLAAESQIKNTKTRQDEIIFNGNRHTAPNMENNNNRFVNHTITKNHQRTTINTLPYGQLFNRF